MDSIEKVCKKEKKELGNVGIHSSFKERSKLNFDFISQVLVALREKISREKIDENQCSKRRQLFFDKISSILKSAKCEGSNEWRKGKE